MRFSTLILSSDEGGDRPRPLTCEVPYNILPVRLVCGRVYGARRVIFENILVCYKLLHEGLHRQTLRTGTAQMLRLLHRNGQMADVLDVVKIVIHGG